MKIKLFGRQNQGLEKRIFISYFFFTLFLILVLLLVEWQLARFGIFQNEDINIGNYLTEFEIGKNSDKLLLLNGVSNFSMKEEVIEAVQNKNVNKIDELINPEMQNLVICSRERDVWYGIKWDLIDRYLPQIFRKASQNQSGSFVASLDKKLYLIAFAPCLTEDLSEMVGICINSIKLESDLYNLQSNQKTALLPYKKEIDFSSFPEIETLSAHINDAIKDMIAQDESRLIHKTSNDYAVGITILNDLEGTPSGIFIVFYQRFVNSFVQQSILLFVLILIAISLIMLSLLGSWFSRAILLPVKNLNEKMKEIATNPSDLGKFERKYTGVLGEMVNSFNIMNVALSVHSKTLNDYKLITDNIETGIFWLDNDFKIILCNPSFLKITEKSDLEDVIGENLCAMLNLKIRLKDQVITGINTFHTLEINPEHVTKKIVVLNIRAEKSDEELRFFGSITDITSETKAVHAKEALELALIKSNKLAEIGRNVEGIVHNLNSPLNSILGYSQLIKRSAPETRDIDKILQAGRAAAKLVKGLLDKVKKGNVSMMHPVSINEVIEQELELCNHNLFYKHFVILEKDLEENLPKILANHGDISLVVANILNNAFEAMKNSEDKILKVSTISSKENIKIEIEDSGEGILPQNLNKIFEAYFSTKKQQEGTGFGLGLAITKQIIEKHQGKISVQSEVKKGTKFTVLIPIKLQESK